MKVIEGKDALLAYARGATADGDGYLVPCRGCGEWPVIKDREQNGSGPVRIECPRCHVRTGESTCFAGPMTDWNRVMGA